jgi:hypothetical protein
VNLEFYKQHVCYNFDVSSCVKDKQFCLFYGTTCLLINSSNLVFQFKAFGGGGAAMELLLGTVAQPHYYYFDAAGRFVHIPLAKPYQL